MNGAPLLEKIAKALARCRLEAVLIGNAAAALHGAPVTTVDVDFMFRKTPANLRKLKKFGALMNCMVFQPYYGSSGLYRAVNEDDGIQVDFMSVVHGVRGYSSLKSRATAVTFGGSELLVASLDDVIASKRAAGRPRDRAVLEVLEKTLRETKKNKGA
jgi:predicted nucleotidyltransferase